jgi:DNA polymerase
MTAAQKTALARFLDAAGDSLGDGYAPDRDYGFTGDSPGPEEPAPGGAVAPASSTGTATPPEGGFSTLPLAYRVDEEEETLEGIAAAIRRCGDCILGKGRKQAVPGEGAERPLVLVVGEGPGAEEDASGRPFVGPAGQLLDRMLAAIKLSRAQNCFIANTVKCHPPGNRDPGPEESAACAPFLEAQIRLLRPRAILCVGRIAAQNLLETPEGITRLRGRFFHPEKYGRVPLLPTFHPSAVLRDQNLKAPVWEDLKLLKARLAELDQDYAALWE